MFMCNTGCHGNLKAENSKIFQIILQNEIAQGFYIRYMA